MNRQQPFVSIAIPAYKKEYLKETIISILNQDYTNFELIIVNDKSPANLDEIVKQFKDKRIRYYKNSENLGKKSIVYNWNRCLSYAKGEFFVLICDDDIMKPDFISHLLNLSFKYPQCNVFRARREILDELTQHTQAESLWPIYETYNDFLSNTILGKRKHTISEFLYRTDYIKLKGGYDIYPVGFYADDASILKFSQQGGIVCSPKILLTFRKSLYHISSPNIQNFQKVKAALKFYQCLFSMTDKTKQKIILMNQLDYDLYKYFINAPSFRETLNIIFYIPPSIWEWRKKLICVLKKYIKQNKS